MPIEAASIMSGVTAVGHAVNVVKTLMATLQAMGKAEMVTQLIDLQSALLEIQQKQMELLAENGTLQEENKKLRKNADLEKHIFFNDCVYRVTNMGNADGFYCPTCHDSKDKFVRVHRFEDNGTGWSCKSCHEDFYQTPPPSALSAMIG